MDRLAAAVADRGITIFARIDHAAAASTVGMALRPMEVLIFGNPRAGTPLMQIAPTLGIDLPLKALVWRDDEGKTWLAYNDPAWLVRRHGPGDGAEMILNALKTMLESVVEAATGSRGES
jgi:uncharacterized protein (DUF302 family)